MSGLSSGLRLNVGLSDRIVSASGQTILGWRSEEERESGRPAGALTFPGALLASAPATTVVYGANLPAPGPKARPCVSLNALLDPDGALPGCVRASVEDAFLQASLAGGHLSLATYDGRAVGVAFRWLCTPASSGTGFVWHCYVRLAAGEAPWRALAHTYAFHPRSGMLLSTPPEALALDAAALGGVVLRHPKGQLTSFPCRSGRVKLTALASDGWAERRLLNLVLSASGTIEARFSDGARATIGIAAPVAAALAA